MNWKSFKRPAWLIRNSSLLACLILVISCSNKDGSHIPKSRVAMGGVHYGGLFRMNLSEPIRSIFPHNMVDAASLDLMNQVYEGLMRINPNNGKLEFCLATSCKVSDDGLTYTFEIRRDVVFHDDKMFPDGKGRKLTADDVAFCFAELCKPSEHNQQYAFLIDALKGGRDYFESNGENSDQLGISVIDEHTLVLTLAHPLPIFLTVLTHPSFWIFPKELLMYENDVDVWCIGTGPFQANTIKVNDVMIFERNKLYWGKDTLGNSLPYIDALRCNFISDQEKQLDLFYDGRLDFIKNVPFNQIALLGDLPEQFEVLTTPALKVEYYGFQHKGKIFSDIRIRQAVNHAINRGFLVDSILLGYGRPARHGFIPSALGTYPTDSVNGLTFNPTKAQALLAEAGFPNGEGFPVLSLQLNDGNSTVLDVAEAVQEMLRDNLGITVELSVLPRALHYEQIEAGQTDFWRDSWIGDYPDPENFLKLFYGKLLSDDPEQSSYLNTVRFKNAAFDGYFEKALTESDPAKRIQLYLKADRELVAQAAVVPLYYEQWVWLINKRVANLKSSSLGFLDLSEVYFRELEPIPAQ